MIRVAKKNGTTDRRTNPTASDRELPTPRTIEQRAAAIRKAWTPRVQRRRRAEAWHALEMIQLPLVPRRKGFWGD